MKKKWLVLPVLLLLFLTLCAFDESKQRIDDDAAALTEEEEEELEASFLEMSQTLKLDLVMVTINDAGGKTSQEYADDFYDEGEFGYEGAHGSGALFLIDLDNRRIWLSTAGEAIMQVTDEEVELVLDNVYNDVVDGYYYDAGRHFLSAMEKYASNNEWRNRKY